MLVQKDPTQLLYLPLPLLHLPLPLFEGLPEPNYLVIIDTGLEIDREHINKMRRTTLAELSRHH